MVRRGNAFVHTFTPTIELHDVLVCRIREVIFFLIKISKRLKLRIGKKL